MPFERPSLPQLIDRVSGDLESRMAGVDARLRRSNAAVLSRVHAGATHGLYGYLAWLALQLLPDTAESEHLLRHASIWGQARRAAVPAAGGVTFSGANDAVIPAGTLLQRSDEMEFVTDVEVVIAAGAATATVTAVTGSAASKPMPGPASTWP